ncbi:YcdB/YcdC domain-containing protein [Ammoniphilus sp. YIM 78166]|uniref:YcdB/YcdC domain-containing protein n=1 Tax=Ammoniphilus sp. YIM 78166 TaxID=1644106 RepID=UPI00106FE1F7|nr:YcdB/YcdC domain-containing protein [Ammoniphilus sp. YIM 78166]
MRKNPIWSRLLYSTLAASLMVTAIPVAAGAETVTTVTQQVGSTQAQAETTPLQEAKISREKALEIAKGIAGDLAGFDEPNVSRRTDRMGPYQNQNVWEINWMKRGPQFSHVDVAVDADTGVIRRYSRHVEGEQEAALPPKVKYEDAVKIANDFVKKHFAEHLGNLKYNPREGEDWGKVIRSPHDSYQVAFVEQVNGIPFSNNQLSIQISGDGKIRYVYYNSMSNVTFAAAQGVLSKDEILKRLADSLDMKLAYQIEGYYPYPVPSQSSEQPKVYVGYQPSPYLHMLDAKTGEAIDYRGKPIPKDQDLVKLAETKQADPLPKLAAPLTQEQAMKKIEQFVQIPKEVNVSTVRSEEMFGRKTWTFHFEYHTPRSGMGWQGGSIDAETGEVIYFDISSYLREKASQGIDSASAAPEKKTFAVTTEQAQEKALAFVREQSKDKLHQLYLYPVAQEEPTAYNPFYRFNLERRLGGIAVPFHNVSVAVSADTGEVVEYRQNWDWNLKLPEVGQVVEPAQAKDTFMKDVNVVLEYQVIMEDLYRYGRPVGAEEQPLEARLVYRITREGQSEPIYLDAATGKWLSLKTGEEVVSKGEKPAIQDIQGHWAEKGLTYLAEAGVLEVKDGKLAPNEQLTRGEFVEMLMGVIDGNYRRYYYPGQTPAQPSFGDVPSTHKSSIAIEWAVERGVLDKGGNFRPDEKMNREDAASVIVKALGYAKLAENPAMFKLAYSDESAIKAKGAVAIVSGIGIMNGFDGKFNPAQSMTRAESAVTLFKFLQKRIEYRPNLRF